jgi:hypothetical protein
MFCMLPWKMGNRLQANRNYFRITANSDLCHHSRLSASVLQTWKGEIIIHRIYFFSPSR